MNVAVCIVGYRNAADIAACLNALGRSSYRQFEVVIVENGGPAAFAHLCETVPRELAGGQEVRFIDAGANLGFAGGINRAMAGAPDADGWWVLNPDCQPEPGALAALVQRLLKGDVHAVGGVLQLANGQVQGVGGKWRRWLGRAVSLGRGHPIDAPHLQHEIEAQLDYLLGASCLVGRAFAEQVGPMREDYFLYAEEIDWFLRAKALGLRLGFASDARVLHHQGTTTGSGAGVRARPRLPIYLDERNKLHVVRDNDPIALPVALLASPALSALRFARRGAWRQWRWALQGWRAALRNERGVPPWL